MLSKYTAPLTVRFIKEICCFMDIAAIASQLLVHADTSKAYIQQGMQLKIHCLLLLYSTVSNLHIYFFQDIC